MLSRDDLGSPTWTTNRELDRRLQFAEVLALPGVDEYCQLNSTFGFMAFHGGNLERRTERIAWEAADSSEASVYTVTQPWGMRHHYPSATVDPDVSDALASFLGHCEVVVAIHGFGRSGHWHQLLLGGQNRRLAKHLGEHLRLVLPEQYEVVTDIDAIPKPLRGLHADNPVNRARGGGVQVELPPGVRGLTPYANRFPAPFPDLIALIEGLSAGARSWSAAH